MTDKLILCYNCNTFFVSCNKYNTKALGFYEKMGGKIDKIIEDNIDKSNSQVMFIFNINDN